MNFVNSMYYISIATAVSILAVFSPAFLGMNISILDSSLGQILRQSNFLRMAQLCCFPLALPMTSDIVLDLFFNVCGSHLEERFVILLTLIIPQGVCFVLYENVIMPFLYIALQVSTCAIIFSVVICAVYKDCQEKGIPVEILMSVFYLHAISIVTKMYSLSFPHMTSLAYVSMMTYALSLSLFAMVEIFWLMLLIRKKKNLGMNLCHMTYEECRCTVYMGTFSIYIFCILVLYALSGLARVADTKESNIVALVVLQIVFCTMVTILPGRLARLRAEEGQETLSLKRVFVRYVSHEIRSPLNIVHAGLDMLKCDLAMKYKTSKKNDDIAEEDDEENKVLDLLEDIYQSSDNAITILNDLLQYENIDAGIFKLECAWRPLTHLFSGKLKSLLFLTKKNKIALNIIDEFNVTGMGSKFISNGSQSKRLDTSHNNVDTSPVKINTSAVVFVDIYRLEQVLRNLITNSIKFTPMEGAFELKVSALKYGSEDPNAASMSENDNFLQNAIDIESGLSKAGEEVGILRVEITDSGVGIAPEDHNKLFGQFAQFNRNELQSGGGSGLGLWISRQIVHMHGGKMGFSSKGLGHGCTFFFEMPIYRDENCTPQINYKMSSDEAKSATSFLQEACKYMGEAVMDNVCCHALVGHKSPDTTVDEKVNNNNVNNSKTASSINTHFHDTFVADPSFKLASNVNVLIVDDSSMNRKIIRRMIVFEKETLPHVTFFEADDGRSAVDLMQDNLQKGVHFDFVLMDFVMITMHGPEAASVMRNTLRYSGPIIGVTGNALQHDIDNYLQQGADLVLLKPLTREKLINGLQCTYNAMHK